MRVALRGGRCPEKAPTRWDITYQGEQPYPMPHRPQLCLALPRCRAVLPSSQSMGCWHGCPGGLGLSLPRPAAHTPAESAMGWHWLSCSHPAMLGSSGHPELGWHEQTQVSRTCRHMHIWLWLLHRAQRRGAGEKVDLGRTPPGGATVKTSVCQWVTQAAPRTGDRSAPGTGSVAASAPCHSPRPCPDSQQDTLNGDRRPKKSSWALQRAKLEGIIWPVL